MTNAERSCLQPGLEGAKEARLFTICFREAGDCER
jgi:hypothetical protein